MNEINLKKISIFSLEILNSLISCYNSKSQFIKTELEFQDDLYNLSVIADEIRLKQIVLNLISNAVKFTKSGFILIKCFKHPVNNLILISVSDSGAGIKDENQKFIFKDYFMESEGYRNNSHGTGIGLSICKNMANRMNMDIKFTSQLRQGSEFTIEISIKEKIDIKHDYIKSNIIYTIEKKDNDIIINNKDFNETSLSLSV
jgi:signal transduction histidine kinase